MKSKFIKNHFILLLSLFSSILFSQNVVATQESNQNTTSWLAENQIIWLSIALIAVIIIGSVVKKKT